MSALPEEDVAALLPCYFNQMMKTSAITLSRKAE
jgi:hypothetical protein